MGKEPTLRLGDWLESRYGRREIGWRADTAEGRMKEEPIRRKGDWLESRFSGRDDGSDSRSKSQSTPDLYRENFEFFYEISQPISAVSQ